MYQVQKRDGKVVKFDLTKITDAIRSAFDAQETAYHPDIAEGADFIIDASGCQWKQLASGMHYPMGMSSVIKATSNLHTDTLYFVYPEDGHSRYGWAFPLSNGMWNIGVWDPDNPKNLQVLFDGFKERFLDRYLSDIVVVQPLRGAPLGTICPHTAIIPGAISCGDAAGLCDPHSGEGVSYALQSGIELAESIPT